MLLLTHSYSPVGVRLRKVWQKRKCTAKNGYLTISHGTVSKAVRLFPTDP